jgi:hypothetical protein
MKTIRCYEVMGNTECTEGRGPMKVVARFSSHDEAVKFVRSKTYSRWCVMGYQSPDDVRYIHDVEITILDTIQEFEDQELSELKARALKKLTSEERKALGL